MGKLVLIVVTYFVSDRTIDENIQVKIVPAEGVGPTECKVGQGRTDVSTIVSVNLSIGHTIWTTEVLILNITNPNSRVLGINSVNTWVKRSGRILNVLL